MLQKANLKKKGDFTYGNSYTKLHTGARVREKEVTGSMARGCTFQMLALTCHSAYLIKIKLQNSYLP